MIIRPAHAVDQRRVRHIVRGARLYPLGLHWQNFLVAEVDGQLVGVGQVRPHRDGSRELASIAVMPEFQGQGVGSQMVQSLLDSESGPLHLMCAAERIGFYERFDFHEVSAGQAPWSLRWKVRAGTVVASTAVRLGIDVGRVAVMKYAANLLNKV